MKQPQYREINLAGITDPRIKRALLGLDEQVRAITNFNRDLFKSERGQARVQGPLAPRAVDSDPTRKVTAGVKNELVAFGGNTYQKLDDELETRNWGLVGDFPDHILDAGNFEDESGAALVFDEGDFT